MAKSSFSTKKFAKKSAGNDNAGTPSEEAPAKKKTFKKSSPKKEPAPAAPVETEEPPAPVEQEETQIEEVVEQPTEMVAFSSGSDVEGEVDMSDIQLPSLKIVQAVGPLSEDFEQGVLVLNHEYPISDADSKVGLTVLRIKKQYEQNIDYENDETPLVFDTLTEVKEAGGWIDWRDGEKPPFSPVAHALCMIEQPEGAEDDPFIFDYGETRYCMAQWKLKGTGYTRAAKAIFTEAEFGLKQGLVNGKWLLSTKRVKAGKNMVYAPIIKRNGKNPADVVEYLRSCMAG